MKPGYLKFRENSIAFSVRVRAVSRRAWPPHTRRHSPPRAGPPPPPHPPPRASLPPPPPMELDSAADPLLQRNARFPAELGFGARGVQADPVDLTRTFSRQNRLHGGAHRGSHQLKDLPIAHLIPDAQVVHPTHCPLLRYCGEVRSDDIIHVNVIPGLGTITEDGRALAGQHLPTEDCYYAGSFPGGLSRALDIRIAQDRVV